MNYRMLLIVFLCVSKNNEYKKAIDSMVIETIVFLFFY